jgi:hypothetical protein
MVAFFLCAWAAVCTIYGLRLLLGPNEDNKSADYHMIPIRETHELELRVTVMQMNGKSWRVVHRFNAGEIHQIVRICLESLDALPRK